MSRLKQGAIVNVGKRVGSGEEYTRILSVFEAELKKSREAVEHLKSLGFTTGQARSAVYRYRRTVLGNIVVPKKP
jgi:hypothetical protein